MQTRSGTGFSKIRKWLKVILTYSAKLKHSMCWHALFELKADSSGPLAMWSTCSHDFSGCSHEIVTISGLSVFLKGSVHINSYHKNISGRKKKYYAAWLTCCSRKPKIAAMSSNVSGLQTHSRSCLMFLALQYHSHAGIGLLVCPAIANCWAEIWKELSLHKEIAKVHQW